MPPYMYLLIFYDLYHKVFWYEQVKFHNTSFVCFGICCRLKSAKLKKMWCLIDKWAEIKTNIQSVIK